ncbi:TPA: N-acetylmuramoyl-L-alanine amidase [Clostridioides difficile]|uniref:N-acetylmuramoyl-L-alanine amidase n=1 Tax=Clostridioides difficile TaxID=1496 RepID=UPI001033AB0C|nr:N-acetylmuramoyl-L-alanine amidase [Clostridioides difficile]EJA5902349.1 N-acetylmuramoyl-L-alanine amidase [Clostridioides difficile]MBY2766687.1 N-acetylmuramoyl-L-alanine amidase [Clostridioides difficile]MDE3481713.1 N-acetylmuramoyl-L-alanine amidase [Clostridioides difficile]MDE3496428.1 N-acetylmuramoyl-L-alanine amidase [Clostridioides difficile]MDE3626009.1 N-acetylmuramoyl-L-alanine amidase [Clostridioides difficile]
MGYTNSSMVAYTKLSPNHSGQRTHSIDRISPHCVVGQCTAEGLGDWFAKSSTQASSNYGIDRNGRVGLYVEEKNRSWCTSSNANDQRAITIECASGTTEPYTMNNTVYETLIKLCTDICKRNGKKKLLWFADKDKSLNYTPKSDEMVITVHRWFANKSCPGNWLYARLGDVAARVTANLGGKDKTDDVKVDVKYPATPFTVRVIINNLNYRSEPSMNGRVNGQTGIGTFTIMEVKNGWGRLKSGVGWIWLENPTYCTIGKSVASGNKISGTKTVDELAKEVIKGLWGNGADRKAKLTAAGYDYAKVQNRVNELLK